MTDYQQDSPKQAHEASKPVSGTPYGLLAVLLTLYFAQGLPAGFITQALPAILRDYDVSLSMIGLSGLLLVPWALKFLWAPIVDKYFLVYWGRSRSWILPLQLLSAVIVAAVGLFNPQHLSSPQTLWGLYALLFFLSLIGATHDVAADGLATRSLSRFKASSVYSSGRQSQEYERGSIDDVLIRQRAHSSGDINEYNQASEAQQSSEGGANRLESQIPLVQNAADSIKNPYQGMGNAVQVIGYRMGLILGGGVFLLVLSSWSWRYSFFAMAGLILLNTLPIWRYPENKRIPIIVDTAANRTHTNDAVNKQRKPAFSIAAIKDYVADQYGYFWSNTQMRAWLGVLLTFKVVDGISSGMVKPMMVDMGIPTGSIGLWASVLGSIASLIGAALAAWILKRLSHHNALLGFNAFQVVTTALYVVVAIGFEHPAWFGMTQLPPFWWAYAANAIEHMAAALALVAMLTMVMHYARHDKAGSDFTTQVCLLTLFSGGSHLLSGFLAEQLGYTGHFILSVAVGVLCLLPIIYWRKIFVKQLEQEQAAK